MIQTLLTAAALVLFATPVVVQPTPLKTPTPVHLKKHVQEMKSAGNRKGSVVNNAAYNKGLAKYNNLPSNHTVLPTAPPRDSR